VAVEFLSDEQAARYGAFVGVPSRTELERYFFLDDTDREAVQAKRRAHNRLGFAVQLTSVRYLGRFMPDPRQVPAEVVEYLAEQLEIADPSCLKQYGERAARPGPTPGRSRRQAAGRTSPRSRTS
jgi:TnpA family transposase